MAFIVSQTILSSDWPWHRSAVAASSSWIKLMELSFPWGLDVLCKKMHLLHGKNRRLAKSTFLSEPTSSAGAGDQTAVTLTCYAVGCCWAVDESDLTMTSADDGYTRRNRHQKIIFSQINGWFKQQKGIVTLTCDASMYRKSCVMMDHRLEDFCEILWNPFEPQKNRFFPLILYPICFMYGIFTIIYLQNWVIFFGPMLVNIYVNIPYIEHMGVVLCSWASFSHGSSWPGLATRNLRETSVDRRGKERTVRMRCWISVPKGDVHG